MGAGWESPDQPGLLAAMPHIQRALMTGRPLKPLSAYLEGDRHTPGVLNTLWVNIMVRFYNDPLALAAVVASLPELAVTESEVRNTNSAPRAKGVKDDDLGLRTSDYEEVHTDEKIKKDAGALAFSGVPAPTPSSPLATWTGERNALSSICLKISFSCTSRPIF